MSSNGSRPGPRRGIHLPRRIALVIGTVAALLIAGVLVAPLVILSGGPKAKPCAEALLFLGGRYVQRDVPGAVADIAIGVGVVSGCGGPPTNVNIRSLTGVGPGTAVAGEGSEIFVRRTICPGARAARLLACLRAN